LIEAIKEPKELNIKEIMSEEGVKFDSDKVALSLFPQRAFVLINEVFNFGAKKYAAYNWKKLEKKRLFEAMQRHISALQQGEIHDQETGLPHIAHIATNAAMLTELHFDRPNEHVTGEADSIDNTLPLGPESYNKLKQFLYPEQYECPGKQESNTPDIRRY
jgi:hypothetical protein